ncbi:putative protein phosphatase 2C 4 [Dendrobium catenatum]|uniref:Uncharacterized protein n=1 Tax=Dendrobium catenatum TaxID=906689 RepID=A0A2I0XDW3_9ASPA|nr:putative protein phosphatase 2C 4 [Dendrobium catenatum]
MYSARKEIKTMFRNVKRSYKPFTTIIKRRWDTQLRQGIHSAANYRNPHFQYDRENYCQKLEILQSLVEIVGNKDICTKPTIAMNEVRLFRDGLESFGKPIALTMTKEMQPVRNERLNMQSINEETLPDLENYECGGDQMDCLQNLVSLQLTKDHSTSVEEEVKRIRSD